MKYIYGFLALAFLGFMFSFGLDREIARSDYVKLLGKKEGKVSDCLYSCNCRYYNELLEQNR